MEGLTRSSLLKRPLEIDGTEDFRGCLHDKGMISYRVDDTGIRLSYPKFSLLHQLLTEGSGIFFFFLHSVLSTMTK